MRASGGPGPGNRVMAAAIQRATTPALQRNPKRKREDDFDDVSHKRRRVSDEGDWVPGEVGSEDYLFDFGGSSSPEMDDLIAQFENLSISFDSDLDGESHEVYPSYETGEIIVESNPVPLKAILASGSWLGVPLGGAQAQLAALAATATTNLSTYAGSRSAGDANSLRATLRQIGHLLKHLTATKAPIPMTDLSASADFGSTSLDTVGTHVIAAPLSVRSETAGSAPKKDSRLMKAIRQRAKTAGQKSKSFKQMHLLNDNVFGPGLPWNLTPGTPICNSKHEREIETPLKRAIYEKGLVLRYEAIVTYANDPMTASQADITSKPDLYRFQRIKFVAKEYVYNQAMNTFTLGNSNDPDVKAVDGATLQWSWGNTAQLVTKPRILSCVSVDDLVTVGIPKASAVRIVAYNKACPKSHPSRNKKAWSGTNRQGQLIDLISKYDGKKRMPAKWSSASVLWSL